LNFRNIEIRKRKEKRLLSCGPSKMGGNVKMEKATPTPLRRKKRRKKAELENAAV
jgi:hypothetical protein